MSFLPDFGNIGKIFTGGLGDNPKGTSIGAAIGSFIPGVGTALGGRIGDFLGDVFSDNDTQARGESGTAVDTPPSQIELRVPTTQPIVEPRIQFDERRSYFPMQPTFNEGFIGSVPGVVGNLFRNPVVSGGVGAVAGAIADFFFDETGEPRKLRITRKLQRDMKKLFMMSGGNLDVTAQLYRQATGRTVDEQVVLRILFKTFSNNGPYVTRAAVRNMRRTYNKLDRLCDLRTAWHLQGVVLQQEKLCRQHPSHR